MAVTAITTAERAALDPAELRLWQLVSPMLPIGAYAYSEGLESAVALGWVDDEASARSWILGQMEAVLGRLDLPLLSRMHDAACAGDEARVWRTSRLLLAHRATAELRTSDRQLAQALARALPALGIDDGTRWGARDEATFAALFALTTARWGVRCERASAAYLWAWLENQVSAGIKLVPLGQSAGQRILTAGLAMAPAVVATALALSDDEVAGGAPALSMASARHETQYSRLFRS